MPFDADAGLYPGGRKTQQGMPGSRMCHSARCIRSAMRPEWQDQSIAGACHANTPFSPSRSWVRATLHNIDKPKGGGRYGVTTGWPTYSGPLKEQPQCQIWNYGGDRHVNSPHLQAVRDHGHAGHSTAAGPERECIYGAMDIGHVTTNQLTRYDTERTVSYSPYEIAFYQNSGPQVFMRWWDCFDPYNVSYHWVELTHGDWEWLTYEYPDETDFCIDVMGGGTGSFDGWISWDGYP